MFYSKKDTFSIFKKISCDSHSPGKLKNGKNLVIHNLYFVTEGKYKTKLSTQMSINV